MHLYGDCLALLSKLISISDIAGNYILYLDIQTSTKLNMEREATRSSARYIYFFFNKILSIIQ